MYHGDVVPGFPQHPHRGFETVTIVRRGLIDHSDSLGRDGALRRGRRAVAHGRRRHRALGDVPAAATRDGPNPLELFQIWLNLPSADKLARAALHDAVGDEHPAASRTDDGRADDGGHRRRRPLGERHRPRRPRRSRGRADPDADVAIWTLRMEPARADAARPRAAGHEPARSTSSRGPWLHRRRARRRRRAAGVDACSADAGAPLRSGRRPCELLLLQGQPDRRAGRAVRAVRDEHARRDPAGVLDYRRTQFGGWPWPSDDPVHPREQGPLRPPRRRARRRGRRGLTPATAAATPPAFGELVPWQRYAGP